MKEPRLEKPSSRTGEKGKGGRKAGKVEGVQVWLS